MSKRSWGGSFGLVLACAIGLASLAGCGEDTSEHVEAAMAEEVEVWRFAIEETRGSVQHAYAQRFKEIVERRTDGAVEVVIYPYGTLGTSDDVTELLRMGTVKFAMASPGHIGTLIPEMQVLLLHFVFSDDPRANKRALADATSLRQNFNALYEEKGLKLLSVFQEGWMVWTANREIREPADFNNLRIRVMTSPMLLASYRAYGANPTPLSYGEVYSALQLRMIDAQVNPIFAIQEMKFHEVSDWLIMGRHAPFVATAVTNRDFFDGLSPERQQVVSEAIDELHDYIFEVQTEYNDERLELIRESAPSLNIVEQLTAEQREAFRQASMPVRDQFVEMTGPKGEQILDQLLAAVTDAEKAEAAAKSDDASASEPPDDQP